MLSTNKNFQSCSGYDALFNFEGYGGRVGKYDKAYACTCFVLESVMLCCISIFSAVCRGQNNKAIVPVRCVDARVRPEVDNHRG